MQLVSQKTTIPVPKLLFDGTLPDGRRYLVTEFIQGVRLDEFSTQCCSKPEGQKHTEDGPCLTCSDHAYSNAVSFIRDDVLPQLDKIKSQERGLDGFVMPPSWLAPDAQPPWKGKKNWKTLPLHESRYVLQHGDLAAHNLIMDPQTLQVRALIDWEYAGYFPPGMERWPGSLSKNAYRGRRGNLAQAIAQFLPDDYLECYENWANKDELRKLIESGDLPNPRKLHTTGQI